MYKSSTVPGLPLMRARRCSISTCSVRSMHGTCIKVPCSGLITPSPSACCSSSNRCWVLLVWMVIAQDHDRGRKGLLGVPDSVVVTSVVWY